MYFAIDDKPNLLLALASRLAFLTLDYFVAVSDAVAVVGFGYSDFADIRSGLTDKSFIDARNDDFVYCGAFELDACGFGEVNGVRKAYVENDFVALFGNLPADAVYFKGLFIAVRNAHYHVVEKRAVQSVLCVGVGRRARRYDVSFRAFYLDIDFADNLLGERTFRALNGKKSVFERDGNACGQRDR